MVKPFRRLASVALLLTFAAAAPAWARVVKIEATEPLPDHSDQAVEGALKGALDRCVRGATAMGLSWIWLDRALVLTDKVIVSMVATDDDVDDDDVKVLEPKRPPAKSL